jgi:hypothetical protein
MYGMPVFLERWAKWEPATDILATTARDEFRTGQLEHKVKERLS